MLSLLQPPFGILPWNGNTPGEIEPLMTAIFNRMKSEDLYRIVFHERGDDFTFAQFIQFFSRQDVFPQICVEVDQDGRIVDLGGLCWLAEYDQMPSHTRATGSFIFFRKFMSRKWTLGWGRMILAYYFEPAPNGMGIDCLIGMTPGPNRAARLYSRKVGLSYKAVLPGYTCYMGKPADAHIAMMTRSEYTARYVVGVAEMAEV